MNPEHRDIAMKPMKKAKNKDAEEIPMRKTKAKSRSKTDPSTNLKKNIPTSRNEDNTRNIRRLILTNNGVTCTIVNKNLFWSSPNRKRNLPKPNRIGKTHVWVYG